MNLLSEKNNQLMHRKEVELTISYEKTMPSIADLKKMVGEKVKASDALVHVARVTTVFGKREAKASVHVYDSPESFGRFVPKPKEKKATA